MYKKYLKRQLDFLISLSFIIFLSPILLIMVVLVGIMLGRPVLFKQKRPGLNEKIFTLYKFRTMSDARNENGVLLPDSSRLTRFGKFIRSSSLDELPELFNVLKGDMSIIGPRPLLVRYLPYYSEAEKIRHSVRPGISGLAQVSGRNNLDWKSRLALDAEYIKNISFHQDIKIMYLTIVKVLRRDDVTIIDQTPLKDLDIERSEVVDNQRIIK